MISTHEAYGIIIYLISVCLNPSKLNIQSDIHQFYVLDHKESNRKLLIPEALSILSCYQAMLMCS